MALAERSQEDIDRFVANTASYTIAVEAWERVPLLNNDDLKQMVHDASEIDWQNVSCDSSLKY